MHAALSLRVANNVDAMGEQKRAVEVGVLYNDDEDLAQLIKTRFAEQGMRAQGASWPHR